MAYNLNFAYNSSTNSYKVTGATGTGTSIVIPSTYNGPQGILEVTIIDTNAFLYFFSVTSVTIPDTIIEIRQNAFNQTSIRSIYIPKNVSSIEQNVFANCNYLTSITVDIDNETYSSDSGILYDKEQQTLLVYPAAKNGNSFTIPTQVTTLGPQAIRYALYLTTLNITQNIISADATTLPYNTLQTINVDSQNLNYSSEFGVLYDKNKTSLLKYPPAKQDISFNVPNTVTRINNFGIENVSILQNIIFSSNLTSIGVLFCNLATSLQKIFFLGNAPSLGAVPFNSTNINLKVYRYSKKSGWSSTFGGKDVLLIDSPIHQGLQTFGFPNISQGKFSIKSNRSYQKLAQTDGTSSNIGNFNDIALDYSDFAKNCSTLGLNPTTMLNNLGGVDFANNFVVMRARRGSRFPNEQISDLGNGVMNINSTGPSFGLLSNWYKFFVMSKKGWNTVILFGTNYTINSSLGKLTASKKIVCGYQNTSKLSEIGGDDAPVGGNFNHIAFDYSSFSNECSSLGFDPTAILDSLGGVDFSHNYVVIRASTSSSIASDSISNLGSGVIGIGLIGRVVRLNRNWYRFYVMCKDGWNTVRFGGVDYNI
jgi:BspA type Leucine rich repeat region (6 copies)